MLNILKFICRSTANECDSIYSVEEGDLVVLSEQMPQWSKFHWDWNRPKLKKSIAWVEKQSALCFVKLHNSIFFPE